MENGEMVAVCLDCFDNLLGQFIEAGKYGIPVEKRQYNCMQIPPPPESESSQLITPQERLSKFVRPPALLGLPGPGPGPNPNITGAGVAGLAQVASAAGQLQPPPTVAIVTETQTSMIKPSVASSMSSLQPPGSLGGGAVVAAAAGIGSSGGHGHGVGSLHAQTLVSEAAASVTTSAAATAEKLKSES